jgi:hypothetical protein
MLAPITLPRPFPDGHTLIGAVTTPSARASTKLPYGFATQAVSAWLKRQGDIDEEPLFCSQTGRRRGPPRRLIGMAQTSTADMIKARQKVFGIENVNATTAHSRRTW